MANKYLEQLDEFRNGMSPKKYQSFLEIIEYAVKGKGAEHKKFKKGVDDKLKDVCKEAKVEDRTYLNSGQVIEKMLK